MTEEEAGSQRSRKQRYLTLDDGDGRMLCVSFRELQRECKLQHAWARTIHTFQVGVGVCVGVSVCVFSLSPFIN